MGSAPLERKAFADSKSVGTGGSRGGVEGRRLQQRCPRAAWKMVGLLHEGMGVGPGEQDLGRLEILDGQMRRFAAGPAREMDIVHIPALEFDRAVAVEYESQGMGGAGGT